MNRYYSKLRPVSLGTYPKNNNYINHHNFDDRQFCDDIQDYAWGYVEYSHPLSKEEIDRYDLVDASLRKFYGVIFRVNNRTNKTTARRYKDVMASVKPDDDENHGTISDTIISWYETEEEAINDVKEYNNV